MMLSYFMLTLAALGWNTKKDNPADVFDQMFKEMVSVTRHYAKREGLFYPNMDVSETPTHYKITLETPGIDFKDLKIEVDNRTLLISGEKKQTKTDKDEKMHRQECSYGQFSREIVLPTDADPNTIQARFERHILYIAIQRIPAPPKKVIPIQSA